MYFILSFLSHLLNSHFSAFCSTVLVLLAIERKTKVDSFLKMSSALKKVEPANLWQTRATCVIHCIANKYNLFVFLQTTILDRLLR